MPSFRDLIVFLSGAQFFHTVSHLMVAYFIPLPLDLKFMVLTPKLNVWLTLINAIITIALLGWAIKLKK